MLIVSWSGFTQLKSGSLDGFIGWPSASKPHKLHGTYICPKIPVNMSQIGGSFKNLKNRFGKIWPILIHRVRVFFDVFAWSLGKNKSLQSHLENDCQLSYRQSPDPFRHRWHRPLHTSLALPCFQGSSRRRCQLGIQ